MSEATRYMHSAYIKKKLCPDLTSALVHDLRVFGDMRIHAFAAINTHRDTNGILGMSLHRHMKSVYNVNDYFANSAVQTAKGMISSQKELTDFYISDVEASAKAAGDKLGRLKMQLSRAQNLKSRLISATKSGRPLTGERSGISGVSFRNDGTVRVYGLHGTYAAYQNFYVFEHQWLDSRISTLRKAISSCAGRIKRLSQKLDHLRKQKAANTYSIRFGSEKMWHREMPDAQRKKIMHHKKYGRMQISGRSDAAYGNFVCRYVTEDGADGSTGHILKYRAMNGKEYSVTVRFPYGQKDVDNSIGHGKPCAWTIIDCGNAWRFDVVIRYSYPEPEFIIDSWSNGCIGCDINWDRIAVTETDGSGNFLRENDYVFHLEGLSSGAITAVLSKVLDKIFRMAAHEGKSLVFEDIGGKSIKSKTAYAKSNRHISMFAFSKMRELILYKEQKHGVTVRFVNPAYTSQTGKLKYMRRYGLSVHGSASFVIARRGLGFIDRIPKFFKIRKETYRRPRLKQWGSIYKKSKSIKPSDIIRHKPAFQA